MPENNLIFRLGSSADDTYQDWQSVGSFPYNNTRIQSIKDPEGATDRKEITSIPSPFARIDLVKTAFREVNREVDNRGLDSLDGNTIFHKMVSDTLDVAQIFFDLDKYQDKIEVLKWDPDRDLRELEESNLEGHHYFADALRKYLTADASSYNFKQLRSIYLLRYLQGPREMTIIGATSPSTLFFSNANDQSFVQGLKFGTDTPFDADYRPLYKRDAELVKCFWYLRNSIPNFSRLFPELYIYLDKTYQAIAKENNALRANLDAISNDPETYKATLSEITVTVDNQNDTVEVLGLPLYKRAQQDVRNVSDFRIEPSKETPLKPLVLPIDKGNRYANLTYTADIWGVENRAEYYNAETELAKRQLPNDGATYPYLTIGDLMEEVLIKVPHALNKQSYFNGNATLSDEGYSYLLPIKPLFFNYFTVEELRGTMRDGKNMMEMSELAGGSVRATLRIPISGGSGVSYIEYNRTYYKDSSKSLDEIRETNEGAIREIKFTGFIMPQVHFSNDESAIYNVTSIQSAEETSEFIFWKDGAVVEHRPKTSRQKDTSLALKGENYLIEGSNFDLIQVKNYDTSGLLIPIFKAERHNTDFEFAIDLGTSNTHIEYREEEKETKAFDILTKDQLICPMFVPTRSDNRQKRDLMEEEAELILKDYLPDEIRRESDFFFPTRTVLSYARNADWNTVIDPFTLTNIPLAYNKRSPQQGNKYQCDIKWGGRDEDRMKNFVECLMLMIRNKVLLNEGNLARTAIRWTYPLSMPPKRRRVLQETWDKTYQKYFCTDGSTGSLSESEAPILYYFKKVGTTNEMVNVDIGGGTTDIAFSENQAVQYTSSFRFAANNLFMNAYAPEDLSNGIIDYYKESIKSVLEDKVKDLVDAYNEENNRRPANMASFLFSLKNSKKVADASINASTVDFNSKLSRDENFKIVFILFYAAIIYQIALTIKALNGQIKLPRHIILSGNGSKVVRIITNDKRVLADFTKRIFEKVLNTKYDKELEIIGLDDTDDPKAATCKGCLISEQKDHRDPDKIVISSEGGRALASEDTYETITDDNLNKCMESVSSFFDFILGELNQSFDFDNNFGVTKRSIEIAKAEVNKKGDLKTFLTKGIDMRIGEGDKTDTIDESFFFYPIKGVLHMISNSINQDLRHE